MRVSRRVGRTLDANWGIVTEGSVHVERGI